MMHALLVVFAAFGAWILLLLVGGVIAACRIPDPFPHHFGGPEWDEAEVDWEDDPHAKL